MKIFLIIFIVFSHAQAKAEKEALDTSLKALYKYESVSAFVKNTEKRFIDKTNTNPTIPLNIAMLAYTQKIQTKNLYKKEVMGFNPNLTLDNKSNGISLSLTKDIE